MEKSMIENIAERVRADRNPEGGMFALAGESAWKAHKAKFS